jgi:hypothetical protein
LFQPTFQAANNGVSVHDRREDHPIVNGVTSPNRQVKATVPT